MSSLIASIKKTVEGTIDYQGQKTAERLAQASLSVWAFIAFVVGAVAQNIQFSLAVYAFGSVLTLLLVVPPWPFLRRHTVKWRSTGVQAKKDL